jgi:hypothetical protein
MSLSAALFVGFCAVNGIQLLQQVVEIGEPANNRIYTAVRSSGEQFTPVKSSARA